MTQHLCSTHNPNCYRCEIRQDEYLRVLEKEVIELRAEVKALTAMFEKRRDMALRFDAERGCLQTLIDALASAARVCDEHPAGTDEESYAVHLWEEALDALLAAATKEDDRG